MFQPKESSKEWEQNKSNARVEPIEIPMLLIWKGTWALVLKELSLGGKIRTSFIQTNKHDQYHKQKSHQPFFTCSAFITPYTWHLSSLPCFLSSQFFFSMKLPASPHAILWHPFWLCSWSSSFWLSELINESGITPHGDSRENIPLFLFNPWLWCLMEDEGLLSREYMAIQWLVNDSLIPCNHLVHSYVRSPMFSLCNQVPPNK